MGPASLRAASRAPASLGRVSPPQALARATTMQRTRASLSVVPTAPASARMVRIGRVEEVIPHSVRRPLAEGVERRRVALAELLEEVVLDVLVDVAERARPHLSEDAAL